MQYSAVNKLVFACSFNIVCGFSASHQSFEHEHETLGHKISSAQLKEDEHAHKGIFRYLNCWL